MQTFFKRVITIYCRNQKFQEEKLEIFCSERLGKYEHVKNPFCPVLLCLEAVDSKTLANKYSSLTKSSITRQVLNL